MNLGENIYQFRTAKGLSQGALAEVLEVSRQSISKWENNSAVPELDKLLKMSALFEVTLDELVHGVPTPSAPSPRLPLHPSLPPARIIAGSIMLLFGMVFFLLSVFWGDHIKLGEEFGELLSISIVLISIALLATYNTSILAICAVIYFIYGIVCYGMIHVTGMTNHAFMLVTGMVILVWFIILGLHLTEKPTEEP